MESAIFDFSLNFKLVFLLETGSNRWWLPWREGKMGEKKKGHVCLDGK